MCLRRPPALPQAPPGRAPGLPAQGRRRAATIFRHRPPSLERRAPLGHRALEPPPHLLVDGRVVEQLEVIQAADVAAVVELERKPALGSVTGGTHELHEEIPDELADAAVAVACEGCA